MNIAYLRGIQGDHSGCTLDLVVIKRNVAFQFRLVILKGKLSFYVNST